MAGRPHDRAGVAPTLTAPKEGGRRPSVTGPDDDPLLPLGLDSHRYRVIGNGVAAPVAEAIGWALRSVIERYAEDAA